MGKFKQLGLEPGQGPVAILGAGISGTAAKLLLEKKGWRTNIFDDEKISFRKKDAHQCSFVVQSPGFSPNHHSIKAARDAGKIILSEMDVGLEFADFSELVVVTGTNGKTSLTSILSYVANRLNMPSLALGESMTMRSSWLARAKARVASRAY